ncbi:MAG: hypothetical protein Q4F13_02815 [Pseudomonadota bacterium]|nr:hypothetical protein [Pseudomonadota bacterium]
MSAQAIPLPRLGMDLLSEDAQLPHGAVRRAVNVDIDRDGQFSARGGFRTHLSGSGFCAIGAWGQRVWVQRGGQVFWLLPDRRLAPLLDAGGSQPVAAHVHNGDLWLAAASGLWRVRAGQDDARQASVVDARPRVSGTDTGALTPGVYGVALSLIEADGTESPAVWLGAVRSGGGLALDGLPVRMGMRWQVYLTPADGDVLYAAERVDALLPRLAVGAPPAGQVCETLGLAPLPGGHAVCAKGARLYVARGDTLWFSRPFRPWLHHPAHDFVRFVGRIRVLLATGGGLYVGDDSGVWWLGGDDPDSARMALVTDARAVQDSGLLLRQTPGGAPQALWLGEQGYMLGDAAGQVRAMQPGRIAVDAAHTGRSVYLRRNGRAQVVTLTAIYEPRALAVPLGQAMDLPQGVH